MRSPSRLEVGLVIPTFNAGDRWTAFLDGVQVQSVKPRRLLVIDSSSQDLTREKASAAGFEVIQIEQSQFNHGGTRQLAVRHLNDCDVIVFLTQDAILASVNSVAEIIACFEDPAVAVAYGRQLPHRGATPIEAHARLFNYDACTIKKDRETVERLGTKVFFCSNSFAAYRRSIVMQLGGFSSDLILGEDMEFAARAVIAGYSNMYCATATVYHSHDFSVLQTVRRYFDIGAFDDMNAWMRDQFGSHGGQGLRYVCSEFRYLMNHAPLQIPRALIHTTAKLIGYRLGRVQGRLPNNLKRKISTLPNYWGSQPHMSD